MTAKPTSIVGELAAEQNDRYHRQTLMDWWDQDRLKEARVLVVGAGALGNEIIKLLTLLGVGRVLVLDMDRIESSNLNRSVFFRAGDEGLLKAEVVARRARELNPDVLIEPLSGNVIHCAGLGLFHWADVVLAGLDNRLARLFINSACARTDRLWVDGGIEGLAGVVRAFDPVRTSCYECTMNATDRQIVAQRRSCAMLMRQATERGHVPNTAVNAALVAALQVQEAIKHLHGEATLLGRGIHIDGRSLDFSHVIYPRRDDCPNHETCGEPEPLEFGVADVTVAQLLQRAEDELGSGAVLDLSRDIIHHLDCPQCGQGEAAGAVLGTFTEREALCPSCGTHRVAQTTCSISRGGTMDTSLTLAELGVPPLDIVVARSGLQRQKAWLLDGDTRRVLGPLAEPTQPAQESP